VLIFQQALYVDPSRVNTAFLILAGALVGVPLSVPAILAIRGIGITALSEQPPSSPSPSSSSTSPSEAESA